MKTFTLLVSFFLFQAIIVAQPSNSTQWPVATPESQGVSSEALAKVIATAREKKTPIHSLLVVRNGKLVAEACFFPYDCRSPHDIASVTKPITSTLIGMAIKQGKLKSPAQTMVDAYRNRSVGQMDPGKEKIILEHLLTMSSGLACKSQGGERGLWEMLGSGHDVQYMLNLGMEAPPGTRYVYCSGGMHLLSGLINEVTGKNSAEFARTSFFGPLGIRSFIWPEDPQGVSHGFGNLHLLPEDMARIGQLFLQNGTWKGKQIIDPEWVKAATSSHIKTGGPGTSDYGYGWRIPQDGGPITFEAGGRGGQQISVLKNLNTVIVLTGGGYNSGEIVKQVIGTLSTSAKLPEDPAALAHLKDEIRAVSRPPQPVPATLPETAKRISGLKWELSDNWIGLKSISFNFSSNANEAGIEMEFHYAQRQSQWGKMARVQPGKLLTEKRLAGLDGVPRISGNGQMNLPVALKGQWIDSYSFALEYDEIANTNTYQLLFKFDGDLLSVQAKERTGLFNEMLTGKLASGGK